MLNLTILTLSGNPVSENLIVYGEDRLAAIRIPKSRGRSEVKLVYDVHTSPVGPSADGMAACISNKGFRNIYFYREF
jgi:hypothetical protein